MLLIVRVTSRCNFKCEFCSASAMQGKSLSVDAILRVVKQYHPDTITFEGGDPLVMPPSFYEELFPKLRALNPSIELSMTTNLWNWYKNPEKWGVLEDYDIQVCTSFQYGGKRKITDSRPLTEEIFTDMVTKWKEQTKKSLSFIAVIDRDNADSVLNTVKFAKKHKMFCKLNPCFVSGRAEESYPWDRMLQHYATIVESGLAYWEDNSYQLGQLMLKNTNTLSCPLVPNCQGSFLVLNPDGSLHNCSTDVAANDSRESVIQLYKKDVPVISNECLSCPWYAYCNTCRVYRQEIVRYKSPDYCARVSDALSRIRRWALDHENYFE